ncbi:MAG: hypothetical protein M1830_005745 [Pleopsidium flavum]|nr:MAG: hypothetical protein M1830_005745 [Pleopsidium flavum]
MSTLKVTEGEADFHPPSAGKPCKTWYQVFGDLKSGVRPLVALHGGPGIPGDYLRPLSDLSSGRGIPVVLYDQLGNGRSTHLPDRMGDTAFWTVQLFLDELDNLLAHLGIQDGYDILGQSWGGMLAASHAIRQPKGLRRLVIANSPASMALWIEAALLLRANMPQDVQDALSKHEAAGTTESQEYEQATLAFYKKHVCRMDPWPEEQNSAMQWVKEDPTVYHTMNGPNEFYITGSLKDWSVVDEVHRITAPTLLINGYYDEAQDSVVRPYFRGIPHVKWVQFAESSHMPQLEERDKYMQVVGDFLQIE